MLEKINPGDIVRKYDWDDGIWAKVIRVNLQKDLSVVNLDGVEWIYKYNNPDDPWIVKQKNTEIVVDWDNYECGQIVCPKGV